MILTRTDKGYAVTGQNMSPESMLRELFLAARVIAEDIAFLTEADIKKIMQKAAADAGMVRIEE